MSLQALKNLGPNLDRLLEIEDAVALSAYARSLENEYGYLEIAAPEWLEKSSNILRVEIARRTHASNLAELKRLENELEGYKSIGEKRSEAQKRMGDLQKKLGLTAKANAGK